MSAERLVSGVNEGEGSIPLVGGMNLSILRNLYEIQCETSAQVRMERHTAMIDAREACADL